MCIRDSDCIGVIHCLNKKTDEKLFIEDDRKLLELLSTPAALAIRNAKMAQEMVEQNKDVIYYLTLENENYKHPPIPEGVKQDIVKGLYKVRGTANPKVRILGSGPLMGEALKAAELLKNDWDIDPGVWNVTSFSELRREAEEAERWNLMHPDENQKRSHLEICLSKNSVPTVAVSDYVKMVSEQISPYVPGPYYALGTDGFGRSETRDALRRFFEVDRYYIVLTAIRALVNENKIEMGMVEKVMEKYSLDPEKSVDRHK